MTIAAEHLNPRPSKMRYFLTNAPFAMAASSFPGAVNYAITIILVYTASYSEAGQFRFLMSVFSLLGLASMMETRKVFLSALVADDRPALSSLFINRLCFLLAALSVTTLVYFAAYLSGASWIQPALGWVIALGSIIYAFDLYLPKLQAHRQFNLLFILELIKYAAAFAIFLFVFLLYRDVAIAVILMIGVFGSFHIAYFWRTTLSCFYPRPATRTLTEHLTAPAAQHARTFSISNIVPSSLEHTDKLLVGWIFGMEFLGIYALAYSTGRFFYNAIKPALYIYYRDFVDHEPSRALLVKIGFVFSIIGIFCAIVYLFVIENITAMEEFSAGSSVVVILFLSYGIGMVRAVYCQAFTLKKGSDATLLLRASLFASIASLLLLTAAVFSPAAIALVLLALQYPLRDGLTTAWLARFRKVAS